MLLISLNVMAVRVEEVHGLDVVVVFLPGQEVFVGVVHGPVADPPEQTLGIFASEAPQDVGMMLSRALYTVRKAA